MSLTASAPTSQGLTPQGEDVCLCSPLTEGAGCLAAWQDGPRAEGQDEELNEWSGRALRPLLGSREGLCLWAAVIALAAPSCGRVHSPHSGWVNQPISPHGGCSTVLKESEGGPAAPGASPSSPAPTAGLEATGFH